MGRILPGAGPARGREVQQFTGLNLLQRNPIIVQFNVEKVEYLHRKTTLGRNKELLSEIAAARLWSFVANIATMQRRVSAIETFCLHAFLCFCEIDFRVCSSTDFRNSGKAQLRSVFL